jgi:hypothetical protein
VAASAGYGFSIAAMVYCFILGLRQWRLYGGASGFLYWAFSIVNTWLVW